jgi:hypothetical protein
MKLVEIHAVDAETLEAGFEGFPEVAYGEVLRHFKAGVGKRPALGGEDDLVHAAFEGFGDELFAATGAVDVRGVIECDAPIEGEFKAAKESLGSTEPYAPPPMPQAPKPISDTTMPLLPNARYFIVADAPCELVEGGPSDGFLRACPSV